MSEAGLFQVEWNFDCVPDAELVACCYWEYARESAFIRETLAEMRDDVWESARTGRDVASFPRPAWCDKLSRIQSIGNPSGVFVRGSLYAPGVAGQGVSPRAPDDGHPDAPPLTGSFPVPWQSLSPAERKYRAHIKSVVEERMRVPVRMGQWHDAREIGRLCAETCRLDSEDWNAWKAKYVRQDKTGRMYAIPGAPDFPPNRATRPGINFGNAESLLVEFAWEDFTDDEIATYFRKWVKHARPKGVKAPSGKGHKPGDWRAHLTRLAAMRLLSRYTPREIIGTGRKPALPACWSIHNTKQFAGWKWGDSTKWHDARREAWKVFLSLFPFLSKDDQPLSWERQTPAQ
jgi:hypothetical protein